MPAGSSSVGKATASRLIEVAREVLTREGCANFSMRTLAANAGVHLANVQYYFPTRDDLARALVLDTGERYRAMYAEVLAGCPDDRFARFDAYMEFNLKDVRQANVRCYFIQLWALLMSLDGGQGGLIDELYRIDIEQLCERIAELDPTASAKVCRLRATTLAAIIDGLILTGGAHGPSNKIQNELLYFIKAVALDIATGKAGGSVATGDLAGRPRQTKPVRSRSQRRNPTSP